jgi:hypothetical protein
LVEAIGQDVPLGEVERREDGGERREDGGERRENKRERRRENPTKRTALSKCGVRCYT